MKGMSYMVGDRYIQNDLVQEIEGVCNAQKWHYKSVNFLAQGSEIDSPHALSMMLLKKYECVVPRIRDVDISDNVHRFDDCCIFEICHAWICSRDETAGQSQYFGSAQSRRSCSVRDKRRSEGCNCYLESMHSAIDAADSPLRTNENGSLPKPSMQDGPIVPRATTSVCASDY